MIKKEIFSISTLCNLIKSKLETSLSSIYLRGEITSYKKHISGHVYFTLKDNISNIDCICWSLTYQKINFDFKEGDILLCEGRVTTYIPRSRYQFIVENAFQEGAGSLTENINLLKEKLRNEGLFDIEKKKSLPKFPQKIVLITSDSGAALQDIIHRLKNKIPCKIYLMHSSVQGDEAITSIINSLQKVNQMKNVDLIILTRGGGSAEDLAIFNEESLIREVSSSKYPIMTAIGHETDTPLVDYASDVRAPTPTAAIEMAMPRRSDLNKRINFFKEKIFTLIKERISTLLLRQNIIENRYKLYAQSLITLKQKIFEYLGKISLLIKQNIKNKHFYIKNLRHYFDKKIFTYHERYLYNIKKQILFKMHKILREDYTKLQFLYKSLDHLSYTKTIKRGYALLKKNNNLLNIQKCQVGDTFTAITHEGQIEANIKKIILN